MRLLGLSLVVFPAVLQAQTHTDFFMSGGYSLGGYHLPTRPGVSLHGGVLRQHNRLGMRLGLQYGTLDGERYNFLSGPASGSFGGNTVGATFELTWDMTSSRLRPYVIGGWGVFHTTENRFSSNGLNQYTSVGAAPSAGLGFRYSIGGASLFTEARFIGPGSSPNRLPIMFGIRFDE